MDDFERALTDLERQGRRRYPLEVEPLGGGRARINGSEVLVLCGNDYLGLSQSPQLVEAMVEGARRWGAGATGSRLISGTAPVHREAERRLAALVGLESAVLFPTGYQANVGAIQSVIGPGDCVVSDALNHASIIDGCRLSRAEVRVVPHGSLESVEQALKAQPAARNTWIVTEALFSMDGDEANLVGLSALAHRYGAKVLVDEAHSLGVLGPRGSGLCRALGVVPNILVGTLGKALGCAGAFVAGSRTMTDWVENRARSYVFTTGMAPALAAGAAAAVDLARDAEAQRERVLSLAAEVRAALARQGVEVPGRGPILPLVVGDEQAAMKVSRRLLEQGIFVQGIRPPTVPIGASRLRLTVSAAHARDQVLQAVRILASELKHNYSR